MRKYKLSELFDLQMGKTPSRDNPEYWDNVSHSWISIADMTANGKYITNTKEKITDLAVYETGIKPIFHGTVIMSFKLSVGKVAIVQTGENKVYSNEAIMAFEVRDDLPDNILIRNDYVYYLLSSLNFDNMGNKAVMGKTLNRGIISNTEVSLHNLEKQSEIVYVLDKVSKLIDLRNKQLQKLDELVKARFVELFGDRRTNNMGWKQKPLKECATFYNGKAHEQVVDESGEFVLVTSKCIASDQQEYRRTNERLFPLQRSDICMVMSDVPNGRALAKCIMIEQDNRYTLNQRICCFRNYALNPTFFLYTLNRHEYFLAFNDGDSQTNLRKDDLLACPIILPPIALQEQFATFVKQIDKSKLTVQKSLEKLETLKKALMQKYFG